MSNYVFTRLLILYVTQLVILPQHRPRRGQCWLGRQQLLVARMPFCILSYRIWIYRTKFSVNLGGELKILFSEAYARGWECLGCSPTPLTMLTSRVLIFHLIHYDNALVSLLYRNVLRDRTIECSNLWYILTIHTSYFTCLLLVCYRQQ